VVPTDVDADVDARAKASALRLQLAQTVIKMLLLEFEVRDAVAEQSPESTIALEHRDRVPGAGQLLRGGEARGARTEDGHGLTGEPLRRLSSTQSLPQAVSMIDTSTCLIVTAGWLMPSTHELSHGAGHRRPVNSGKLFVACSRSAASRSSPRLTRSFH